MEAALSLRFLAAPRRQLAVIVAIALLGMAGAMATLQSPDALLCILGLTTLGLVQVALGETRVKDDSASDDSAEKRPRRTKARNPGSSVSTASWPPP